MVRSILRKKLFKKKKCSTLFKAVGAISMIYDTIPLCLKIALIKSGIKHSQISDPLLKVHSTCLPLQPFFKCLDRNGVSGSEMMETFSHWNTLHLTNPNPLMGKFISLFFFKLFNIFFVL